MQLASSPVCDEGKTRKHSMPVRRDSVYPSLFDHIISIWDRVGPFHKLIGKDGTKNHEFCFPANHAETKN
ncbi:hypothetical protein Pdw03_1432 [Penicillium digitatum]|uniref:Uncharacterized protein n=1 Tax=Penicillium digitatum TaxID=36651 RepID=A0A7T7BNQ8_PENDI|nr:hypothetical protein Pdw03_1432 [Penicillium digitatum]